MIVPVETPYLVVVGLLLLGALGALIADRRRQSNLAGLCVLIGLLVGTLTLVLVVLAPSFLSTVNFLYLPESRMTHRFVGAPFAFPILAALLALVVRQMLTGMMGMPLVLVSVVVTGAAAIGALMSADLLAAYAFATLSGIAGFFTIHAHPLAGRASVRIGSRYLLLQLLGDTGLLLAVILVSRGELRLAAGCLVAGGIVRLGLFPFHRFILDCARLPGACSVTVLLVGQAIGMSFFVRAFVLTAGSDDVRSLLPSGVWLLIPIGLLSCVAGAVLSHGAPSYRAMLDRASLIDCGHIAVAVGVATAESLASAVLFSITFLLSRATLLLVADAASERGQQQRRLPNGPSMLPFGLGFGTVSFLPPLSGFVARWLLYLMVGRSGYGWAVGILLVVSLVELSFLIQRVATLGVPRASISVGRPLVVALAPVWVPLGLVAIGPIFLMFALVSPAIAVARPSASWSFGLDVLLSFPSVATLLLLLGVVVVGLATYFRPNLMIFRRAQMLASHRAIVTVERIARIVASQGLPMWLISSVSDILFQLGNLVARPSEQRFFSVAIISLTLALTLIALT